MGIYQKLEKIIAEKNISVAYLARMADIPANTIHSMKRRNGNKMDIDVLNKICSALGISIESFFDEGKPHLKLSDEETALISEYRRLDDRGKKIVDTIIETESAWGSKFKSSDTKFAAGTKTDKFKNVTKM